MWDTFAIYLLFILLWGTVLKSFSFFFQLTFFINRFISYLLCSSPCYIPSNQLLHSSFFTPSHIYLYIVLFLFLFLFLFLAVEVHYVHWSVSLSLSCFAVGTRWNIPLSSAFSHSYCMSPGKDGNPIVTFAHAWILKKWEKSRFGELKFRIAER